MRPRLQFGALLACLALQAHAQAPAQAPAGISPPAASAPEAAAPAGAAQATVPPAATDSTDSNLPAHVVRQQAAEIARGDPPRWYREDADLSAQLKSRRKEIAAALQEALGACRKQPANSRRACQQAARSTYQQEMAGLRSGTVAGR